MIISRHEKIEIERADFCQKSMKYLPGVPRQRRSTSKYIVYCIVRGGGAYCTKLREREREEGGGAAKKKKVP